MKSKNYTSGKSHKALITLLAFVAILAGVDVTAKLANQEQAEIKFVATQSEVSLDGEFRKFSADVDFDPSKPEIGNIRIIIELASADMGSKDANDLLKRNDFFDSEHFPNATYISTSIKHIGENNYQAIGQFTLKGRSLPLTIPFTIQHQKNGLWYQGHTSISRLAYKVGQGEWADTGTLADQVQINFKIFVAS